MLAFAAGIRHEWSGRVKSVEMPRRIKLFPNRILNDFVDLDVIGV
jgi:hypothetical protein